MAMLPPQLSFSLSSSAFGSSNCDVVQVAANSGEASCVPRTRLNAGDLKWSLPVGIEHHHADNERAVLVFVSVYTHGVPHLRSAVALYQLSDRHRDGFSSNAELVFTRGFARHVELLLTLGPRNSRDARHISPRVVEVIIQRALVVLQ